MLVMFRGNERGRFMKHHNRPLHKTLVTPAGNYFSAWFKFLLSELAFSFRLKSPNHILKAAKSRQGSLHLALLDCIVDESVWLIKHLNVSSNLHCCKSFPLLILSRKCDQRMMSQCDIRKRDIRIWQIHFATFLGWKKSRIKCFLSMSAQSLQNYFLLMVCILRASLTQKMVM